MACAASCGVPGHRLAAAPSREGHHTPAPQKVNDEVDGCVCEDEEGKRFLIMLNHIDKPVDIACTVEELTKIEKVRDPFVEDKVMKISIEYGMVTKTLKPLEVLVYNW